MPAFHHPIKGRLARHELVIAAALMAAAPVALAGGAVARAETPAGPCPAGVSAPRLDPAYKAGVKQALDARTDLWGEQVLARPEGPTYDNVKGYLPPLMYVRQAASAGPMTDSEVYYIPFGMPAGLTGRGSVALHVADGSQIMTNKWSNRNLKISVGDGTERFGTCLANLDGPRLYRNHQPVLEVGYTDRAGVRYRQESFATYLPGTQQLASYVKITAQAAQGAGGGAADHAKVRLFDYCGDACALSAEGNRLVKDGKTYLFFSPGATYDGKNLDYDLDLSDGAEHTLHLVRVNEAAPAPDVTADEAGHLAARQRTTDYWNGRLAEGASIEVPEQRVEDAMNGLLAQNLLLGWRYSIGNAYEAFYQPESSDTVETLGHLGFTDVYKSALQDLLPLSKAANRRNWEMGTKLFHASDYYRLTGDRSLLDANEATYVGYLNDLMAQHAADPNHLLERQQFSSDIPLGVYGLHQIGFAQRGAQDIAEAWRRLGRTDLADRYAAFAADLEAVYQDAIRRSQVTLPDGSLFTPVELLDGTQPWDPITAQNLGGYWNLVAYYGFGSRAYPPGSDEARRTLRYIYDHGGVFLGLLRARDSANTNVYAVELLKFLADNDLGDAAGDRLADQLVLSLYGKLAHGMTRDTYVSGEAHNIGPILTKWPACRGQAGCVPPPVDEGWTSDEYYRAMYLPPNTANNTSFLETLRLMLARTTTDALDRPTGLRLAYATPRGWLEQGKRIRVDRLPTEFGELGYQIQSDLAHSQVHAIVKVPEREPIDGLSLRLRVPRGYEMTGVEVNGKPWPRFDAAAETIDLTGLTGTVTLKVAYR